ncbi:MULTISPECIES: 2Fe-2S iron-sulfur cluster-binding protein [Spongiibacter]|jgi:2Fe-2S ferredoxin|uniref:2Fe-2S iron-sulfur cluster-binding protein n=1 Tax=Spongiibacter TaxID=630749 RepID=UPI000C69ED32|nr:MULTISPECIES: 2Fe-2S iron-sulfur cluster-binding protein [Spongiibacter]MBI57024.1 (2Fe-2S)-binding protein [Spongiibacter sp.]|tara:strand:+ start:184 stop:504 length:321 start_codon:yes stop_codon:yes gene_type:complete
MVGIVYVEHDGTEHPVDVDEQMSLMEGATLNMVPGVEGMCGGICSCATCHCYIPEEWQDRMSPVSDGENAMLDNAIDRRENSRLGCQISVGPEMEGLRVYLPETQA